MSQIPNAPISVVCTPNPVNNTMAVSWTYSLLDPLATSFLIERKDTVNTNYIEIHKVASNFSGSQSYIDTTPQQGKTYTYRVTCANKCGASDGGTYTVLMPCPAPSDPLSFYSVAGTCNVTLIYLSYDVWLYHDAVFHLEIDDGSGWTTLYRGKSSSYMYTPSSTPVTVDFRVSVEKCSQTSNYLTDTVTVDCIYNSSSSSSSSSSYSSSSSSSYSSSSSSYNSSSSSSYYSSSSSSYYSSSSSSYAATPCSSCGTAAWDTGAVSEHALGGTTDFIRSSGQIDVCSFTACTGKVIFNATSDDIVIVTSINDTVTQTYSGISGDPVTITLPANYVIFRNTNGSLRAGATCQKTITDGTHTSVIPAGEDILYDQVVDLESDGFSTRNWSAGILFSEMASNGWIDGSGNAALNIWHVVCGNGFASISSMDCLEDCSTCPTNKSIIISGTGTSGDATWLAISVQDCIWEGANDLGTDIYCEGGVWKIWMHGSLFNIITENNLLATSTNTNNLTCPPDGSNPTEWTLTDYWEGVGGVSVTVEPYVP